MSLEFSLKCSQTLWRRHFWWQTAFQVFATAPGNARSPITENHGMGTAVEPVPRSMMNAGIVDQEVQQRAVERQPGRPAPVHGHTGTPAQWVCTLFAAAHQANADGKAAEWCGRVDWTGRRVKPLHSCQISRICSVICRLVSTSKEQNHATAC